MRLPYRGAGTVFLRINQGKYQVFLGRRSDHPFFDFLAVPGGGFDKEKDRNDFDCASRECREETFIDVCKLIKENKIILLGEKGISFPLFSWRSFFFLVKDSRAFSETVPSEFSELFWQDTETLMRLKSRPFTRLEIKRCKQLCEATEV